MTRMRIAVDDQEVSTRVLNDVLFSHKTPAATTRYAVRVGEQAQHRACMADLLVEDGDQG